LAPTGTSGASAAAEVSPNAPADVAASEASPTVLIKSRRSIDAQQPQT